MRPRRPLVLLALLLGTAACSSSSGDAAGADGATPSTAPSAAATSAPVSAGCAGVVGATRGARQVVASARTMPVLLPGVALVTLDLREKASAAAAEPAPYGPVLTELVASIDDLDTQARPQLAPGTDPTSAKVRLDPARLAAALDDVDRVCAGAVAPTPGNPTA